MGYYINALLQGERYELNEETLEFIEKVGKFYYFYICKYDMETFKYNATELKVSYTAKELTYIKRAKKMCEVVGLQRIGRDKVWSRKW